MRLTQFKALSFSCYGTLIDRDSGIYTALRPLLSHAQVTLNRGEILAKFAEYEAQQQADSPRLPYSDVLFAVHRRLAGEWGVHASDADHALFSKSVPTWPAYADVPAALQYLKRFFKLAILSNVDPPNLAGSNRRLEVMFDAIFTAQEIMRLQVHQPGGPGESASGTITNLSGDDAGITMTEGRIER